MAWDDADDVLLFEGFRFDPRAGLFRLDGAGGANPVPLGSRALSLLGLLVRRRGETVSKDDIMTVVWSGRVVEEANLNVQISKLRHILDHGRVHSSCIQTITGYGYRFIAPITSIERPASARVCPTATQSNGEAKSASDALRHPLGSSSFADEAGAGAQAGAKPSEVIAIARVRHPGIENNVEHAQPIVEESLLIETLGAARAIDDGLAAGLRSLRQRFVKDYDYGPAAIIMIDEIIAAYLNFIRVTGWVGNLAGLIEGKLFSSGGPDSRVQERIGSDVDLPGGLIPEQRLAQLRDGVIPLAERCEYRLQEALLALEARYNGRKGCDIGKRSVRAPAADHRRVR